MLVLTRKVGETIVIPDHDLKITVLSVARNKVRIGIAGPPEVVVHREEVWQRLREAEECGVPMKSR